MLLYGLILSLFKILLKPFIAEIQRFHKNSSIGETKMKVGMNSHFWF